MGVQSLHGMFRKFVSRRRDREKQRGHHPSGTRSKGDKMKSPLQLIMEAETLDRAARANPDTLESLTPVPSPEEEAVAEEPAEDATQAETPTDEMVIPDSDVSEVAELEPTEDSPVEQAELTLPTEQPSDVDPVEMPQQPDAYEPESQPDVTSSDVDIPDMDQEPIDSALRLEPVDLDDDVDVNPIDELEHPEQSTFTASDVATPESPQWTMPGEDDVQNDVPAVEPLEGPQNESIDVGELPDVSESTPMLDEASVPSIEQPDISSPSVPETEFAEQPEVEQPEMPVPAIEGVPEPSQDPPDIADVESPSQDVPVDQFEQPDVPQTFLDAVPDTTQSASVMPDMPDTPVGFQGLTDLPSVTQTQADVQDFNDPSIARDDDQVDAQIESHDELAKSLSRELGPQFEAMQQMQESGVRNYVDEQMLIASILRSSV